MDKLSRKFEEFETYEEQSFLIKRELKNKLDTEYLSFYEKFQKYLKLDSLTFSILFGLVLFLLHFIASLLDYHNKETPERYQIVKDFSFFLALMNSAGLFLLLNATEKLREFVVNLISLTNNKNVNIVDNYLGVLEKKFLTTRTFYFGIVFGIINCSLALVFGLEYYIFGQYYLLATFLFQVFTIGFIGGITINQTVIILKMIRGVSFKEDFYLRYFYPDKCAGTLIIGNILLIFSLHFIGIGVFIFTFLDVYDWTFLDLKKNGVVNPYINALHIFWSMFPFLMAGIIFFFPAKRISKILKEYKLFEQLKIKRKLEHIRQLVIQKSDSGVEAKEEIEVLDNHYQKLLKIEEELESVNDWPYNLRYRRTFLSIFLPIVTAVMLEISQKFISKIIDYLNQ